MEDIDAVIKASQHFKYDGDEPEVIRAFNKISDLPESKRNLKRAIKEHIRLLYASYISLASFIPDEDIEYLLGLCGKPKDRRVQRIFKKMLKEMKQLEREITEFDPFELPTDESWTHKTGCVID